MHATDPSATRPNSCRQSPWYNVTSLIAPAPTTTRPRLGFRPAPGPAATRPTLAPAAASSRHLALLLCRPGPPPGPRPAAVYEDQIGIARDGERSRPAGVARRQRHRIMRHAVHR